MRNTSPFSADDRARRPHAPENQTIGKLDASFRAQSGATAPESVKHIAVRDVSGSLNQEEPVHAFMVPNKYLAPNAAKKMSPKRPLGVGATATRANSAAAGTPRATRVANRQPAKMYSQVATFDSPMQRIRRQRTTIPVAERSSDEPWFAPITRAAALVAALVVAAGLYAWDKLGVAWRFFSQKFHSVIVGPTRTTYGMMRGTKVWRYGIEESRFRIVAPVALFLLFFGVAAFNTFVGENFHFPGFGGSSGTTVDQGRAVLQVTPGTGGKGGGASGSATSNPAQGGNSPQSAGQAAQSTGSASSGLQSSSGSTLGSGASPVGGFGGGSTSSGVAGPAANSGVSSPTVSTGSNTVTQAVPLPTITPPAPTPAPTTGGSGSGGIPLPTDPTTPLPGQINVPGTDTSAGGKPVESTTPIGITIN